MEEKSGFPEFKINTAKPSLLLSLTHTPTGEWTASTSTEAQGNASLSKGEMPWGWVVIPDGTFVSVLPSPSSGSLKFHLSSFILAQGFLYSLKVSTLGLVIVYILALMNWWDQFLFC